MKKAAFYSFSATGNTKRICDLFADELRALGYETEYIPVRRGAVYPAPAEYGLV